MREVVHYPTHQTKRVEKMKSRLPLDMLNFTARGLFYTSESQKSCLLLIVLAFLIG